MRSRRRAKTEHPGRSVWGHGSPSGTCKPRPRPNCGMPASGPGRWLQAAAVPEDSGHGRGRAGPAPPQPPGPQGCRGGTPISPTPPPSPPWLGVGDPDCFAISRIAERHGLPGAAGQLTGPFLRLRGHPQGRSLGTGVGRGGAGGYCKNSARRPGLSSIVPDGRDCPALSPHRSARSPRCLSGRPTMGIMAGCQRHLPAGQAGATSGGRRGLCKLSRASRGRLRPRHPVPLGPRRLLSPWLPLEPRLGPLCPQIWRPQ